MNNYCVVFSNNCAREADRTIVQANTFKEAVDLFYWWHEVTFGIEKPIVKEVSLIEEKED